MDSDLKYLIGKIHRARDIDFSLYRSSTLKRRIRSRLRATGRSSYLDYIAYPNKRPEEYDKLIDAITINVSEFFRNPEAFEAIEKKVIPEIIERKKRSRNNVIRAWSAGTSFGEEACSLAILFLEALGDEISDFDLKITGTDIDTMALDKARKGRYESGSLKEVKKRKRFLKYFDESDKEFMVQDRVRVVTRFRAHNVVVDRPLPNVDLILCRNVIIYFTKPLQEMVFSTFARALHEDGVLVLGKVETLSGYPREFFDVVDSRERIYKKRSRRSIVV